MPDSEPRKGATYRRISMFFLVLAVAAWVAPVPTDWVLPLRFFAPFGAVCFFVAWVMAGPGPRAGEPPDLLRAIVGGYFERDGLCFGPLLNAADGVGWFNVYFQNRYARGCRGTAWFVPMEGLSKSNSQPHEVPPIAATVECAGGDVVVVSVPYPVAREWQGKLMVYDVYASVNYPDGRGDLLRSGEGAAVSEPRSDLADLLTAGLLMFGVLRVSKPSSSVELKLPERVAVAVPAGAEVRTEVLWHIDAPTGGFPVEPARPPG